MASALNKVTVVHLVKNSKYNAVTALSMRDEYGIDKSVNTAVYLSDCVRTGVLKKVSITAADVQAMTDAGLNVGSSKFKYQVTKAGESLLEEDKQLVVSLEKIQRMRGNAGKRGPYKESRKKQALSDTIERLSAMTIADMAREFMKMEDERDELRSALVQIQSITDECLEVKEAQAELDL